MHSRATDRRSASKCQGKWPDQTLDQAFGLPEVLVAVSTSRLSCKRAGKTRTLMPVWDSSGESRSNAVRTVWNAGAVDTLHLGFRPIQKIATIHASSGFIRGIPTKAVDQLFCRRAGRAELYRFVWRPPAHRSAC